MMPVHPGSQKAFTICPSILMKTLSWNSFVRHSSHSLLRCPKVPNSSAPILTAALWSVLPLLLVQFLDVCPDRLHVKHSPAAFSLCFSTSLSCWFMRSFLERGSGVSLTVGLFLWSLLSWRRYDAFEFDRDCLYVIAISPIALAFSGFLSRMCTARSWGSVSRTCSLRMRSFKSWCCHRICPTLSTCLDSGTIWWCALCKSLWKSSWSDGIYFCIPHLSTEILHAAHSSKFRSHRCLPR